MNDRSKARASSTRAGIATLFIVVAFVALPGCGGGQPDLTLTCLNTHKTYAQPFTRAYASRRNGDLEIVLADDAAVAALAGSTTRSPVRQILHVHILWYPDHGMGPGAPTVTNATLHWYVLGGPSRPGDVLEYAGTAYVVSDSDLDAPVISIQNASLKCVYQHGLADPIGSSKLRGSVTAIIDDQRVGQLLHEVEQAALPRTAPAIAPATSRPDRAP